MIENETPYADVNVDAILFPTKGSKSQSKQTLTPDASKNLAVNDPTLPKPCIETLVCFLMIYSAISILQGFQQQLILLKPRHNQWFLVNEDYHQAVQAFQYKHAYHLFHVRRLPYQVQ